MVVPPEEKHFFSWKLSKTLQVWTYQMCFCKGVYQKRKWNIYKLQLPHRNVTNMVQSCTESVSKWIVWAKKWPARVNGIHQKTGCNWCSVLGTRLGIKCSCNGGRIEDFIVHHNKHAKFLLQNCRLWNIINRTLSAFKLTVMYKACEPSLNH